MTRLVHGSRRFFLGVAFICVMAATGGLVGAIGGMVLVLLSQVVLGLSAGLLELMPASVGVGTGASMVLGGVLMVRQMINPSWTWQPGFMAQPRSESKLQPLTTPASDN